jgi:hypothetical protein
MHHLSIDIERLLQSSTWRDCQENHPADACYHMTLWLEAVRQLPAGSIPSDDEEIRKLAGCKPEWWEKIRSRILRNWVISKDGDRLFHLVVVENMTAKTKRRVLKKADDYSPEFEVFWQSCLRHKMGGSKIEAWCAWQDDKPKKPDLQRLNEALELYVADVREKDSKFVHPCRFLSKGYWEAYTADTTLPLLRSVHPSWNGHEAALVSEIGQPMFDAWFASAEFIDGDPPRIVFQQESARKWVANHYAEVVARRLGAAALETRG